MDKSKIVSIHNLIEIIKEKLNSNGEVNLTITGNSMYPFFINKVTNVKLVKPNRKLKAKDIVFYKTPNGAWALHRIIKVKKDHFVIIGDALRVKEYIKKEEVIGFVQAYSYKNKNTNCNNFIYKLKVGLWMMLRPFRRYLIALIRKFDRRIK